MREAKQEDIHDLVVVGGGVAGMAAAIEAKKARLDFVVLEASEPFSTIVNFPKGKPIFAYPKEMQPRGSLAVDAEVKEELVAKLKAQVQREAIEVMTGRATNLTRTGGVLAVEREGGEPLKALRIIIAIGKSGDYRRLDVPGEELDKVFNRLFDPADYSGAKVLVVGGGDSALEAAIALAEAGAKVTLSYRGREFSRPKPENVMRLQRLSSRMNLMMASRVREIREREVLLVDSEGKERVLANDFVFTLLGRKAPLDFFKKSGLAVAGSWTKSRIISFVLFVLFAVALYNWKAGGRLDAISATKGIFPYSLVHHFTALASNPSSLLGTLVISASTPSFWYTLAYSILVVVFGLRRIKRRKTPYIKLQTLSLMTIQVVPLFLLPEIILPYLGHNNLLPRALADALFPVVKYGHGREYWRAYGLVLAWPLNVYNVFTKEPLGWWLAISIFQTLVFIPAIIYFAGKGAYCGWICSCGALAETLGDTHRHKMPHGPLWNRLNLAGQVILAAAVLILIIRILGWIIPGEDSLDRFFFACLHDYKWGVDVFLAGVIGYGTYFWLSARVWCRFFCPLAALMHIYARFSRFRILADKKKCISCNLCTAICHQGIDIMNFANKGLPMNDPQCVRCSACLHVCPTGVLSFGQVDKSGKVVAKDRLAASPLML